MSDIQTNQSHWDDPRITAYVLDELDASERAEFEQAMQENESLSQAVKEAREVTGQLSVLFGSEPEGTLDAARRAAIINEPVIISESDEVIGRRAMFGILAVAALVLLMLGLTPMMAKIETATVSQLDAKPSGPMGEKTAEQELASAMEAKSTDGLAREEVAAGKQIETEGLELAYVAPDASPTSSVAVDDSFGANMGNAKAVDRSRPEMQVMEARKKESAAQPRFEAEPFNFQASADDLAGPTITANDGMGMGMEMEMDKRSRERANDG